MFAAMKRQSVTAILITRNESANIDRCLHALTWCDEIIVVDSESTDDTAERCGRYGARVVVRPFNGYGEQKNAALSLATSTWVLSVDADEVITPELAASIGQVLANPTHDAYIIDRRFVFLGKRLRYGRGSVDRVIRLFRREMARFTDAKVHEGVVVNGSIGSVSGEMDHYSYTSIAHVVSKFNTYTSLAAYELQQQQRQRSVVVTFVAWPLYFLKFYVLHGHWRNGIHGFVWSVLSSWYPFLKVAKARLDS
jgi:glycosyltransferase involved in cell wall biosynthesis